MKKARSDVSRTHLTYTAPKLVIYGDAKKLTAGGTISGTENGGNGKFL